jgi:hypothetical protein
MVAFGSIPVEAVVHLSLPRSPDGLPEGLVAQTVNDWWTFDKGPAAGRYDGTYQIVADSSITGRLEVRLSDLSMDGIQVDVGSNCRTATTATFKGHGRGYMISGFEKPPAGSYDPRTGGTMTATLDVPRFTGCGVGDDDLDPLVSVMASGKDFPVKVEQGELGSCWASPPSAIDPATCGEPAALAFPSRESD